MALHKGYSVLRTIRSAVTYDEQKQLAEVFAPPYKWGPWVEIYRQWGVYGPNADKHVTTLDVSYSSVNQSGSFGVQIKGGDELIDTYGPGSIEVTISGNVATSIKMRANSHAPHIQPIDVNVRK